MVDTPVKLADVIVPEIFNPYFVEETTRVNQFFQSGILAPVGSLNFADRGGTQITMPYWKALNERAQLLDDNVNLEIRKIATGQDVAVQHARALVYGGTDLAAALAGSDPMQVIAAGIAENWSYEFNMQTIATLKGAMGALAAEGTPVNVLDISALTGGAELLDTAAFIDAAQLLGDMKDRVSGVLMHSAVEAHLAKLGQIEYVETAEPPPNDRVPMFLGKRVIVDDANTPTVISGSPDYDRYDTWLFGPGALGYGEGSPKVPSETGREALLGGGQEYLVTRRHYVIHPRGIGWDPEVGVPASVTPADAELADELNWARVYDPKNIRIVLIRHRIS